MGLQIITIRKTPFYLIKKIVHGLTLRLSLSLSDLIIFTININFPSLFVLDGIRPIGRATIFVLEVTLHIEKLFELIIKSPLFIFRTD